MNPRYHTDIELVDVSALKANPKNPRIHTKKQVGQIARSIQRFGFISPIVAEKNGQLIIGHGRLLAAIQLGMEKVPAIRMDHLSEVEIKALMLADNKLTENAAWDRPLLAEVMLELQSLDFDLDLTGFEIPEIDLIIEEASAANAADPADVVPEVSDLPAITQSGDVWVLDKHRLLCGNCLDPDAMQQLMNGGLARAVFTDPPYNVPVDGHISGLGKTKHREFAMAAGEMTSEEFTTFLRTSCGNLAMCSMDGALHYICMDWRHQKELLVAGGEVYSDLKNICVWVKDNAGMGSLYRSQHELVLVFKHGKVPHINNVELGKHGRYRTNVWEYAGANSFSREHAEEGDTLALHPTVKPVAMIADAVMDCTRRGDLVLDTFLGSGSTLIAAEKTGRICYGMEIDPRYVDTAVRRWQQWTGKHAVHGATGKTFDEIVDLKEMEDA